MVLESQFNFISFYKINAILSSSIVTLNSNNNLGNKAYEILEVNCANSKLFNYSI